MTETLTFALAAGAYGGLTIAATLAAAGRRSRTLSALVAACVLTHVILIWHDRFAWDLARATRNGYAGFTVFHMALAGIVVAPWPPARFAAPVTITSFLLVTGGAFGAVFRDAAAASFRWPVLAVGIAGLLAIVILASRRRQQRAPADGRRN